MYLVYVKVCVCICECLRVLTCPIFLTLSVLPSLFLSACPALDLSIYHCQISHTPTYFTLPSFIHPFYTYSLLLSSFFASFSSTFPLANSFLFLPSILLPPSIPSSSLNPSPPQDFLDRLVQMAMSQLPPGMGLNLNGMPGMDGGKTVNTANLLCTVFCLPYDRVSPYVCPVNI